MAEEGGGNSGGKWRKKTRGELVD
jgi:hypothetical protein